MTKRRLLLSIVLLISVLFCNGCTGNEANKTTAPSGELTTSDWILGKWEAESQNEIYYISVRDDGTVFVAILDKAEETVYPGSGTWSKENGDGTGSAYLMTDEDGNSSYVEAVDGQLSIDGVLFSPSKMTDRDAMEFFSTRKEQEQTQDDPAYEVIATVLNKGFAADYATLQASAIVRNVGDFPIEISDITFDIETADGGFCESIGNYFTRCIPAVILPGEQGYIACMDILDAEITQDYLDSLTQAKAHFSCKNSEGAVVTQYEVEDVSLGAYSGDYWGIKGRVVNNTDEVAQEVQAVAVLFGADGTLLGILQTGSLTDIKPGDKLGFNDSKEAIPQSALTIEPETIEAYAYSVSTE